MKWTRIVYALALALAAGALAWDWADGRTKAAAARSPAGLHAALGEPWRALPSGLGVILYRPAVQDAAALPELARAHHRLWGAQPGRLYVTLSTQAAADQADEPTVLYVGALVVRGHPDELARVAAACRRGR